MRHITTFRSTMDRIYDSGPIILQYNITIITTVNVNKNPTDATVRRYLFTAKLLYMFRVSQHPSSGVLKTVPAASGTGHNTGTATPLQRGLIGTGLRETRSDHVGGE